MAKITVNEKEIEAQDGAPLLQALLDNGIFVPHFCYHQDLAVDGNCRQCLVEMDSPKGAMGTTSCTTPVKDGMVVRTNTPAIEKARRGVLEYLLVNHPVDCPVCDQAGECRLQQYYMTYGFHESRVHVEKTHKGKTLPVGDRVMLDQERCVLCNRCVRFLRDVTGTNELTIGGRGSHSFITTFPGQDIDNKYSVNLVDVCPVGALTDRDFRFKCRAWYLKQTNTICHGCSRGCNAALHTYNHSTMDGLNGTAYRLKPRRNPEVNASWMCDEGRLLYQSVNDDRLEAPALRGEDGLEQTTWGTALDFIAENIKAAGDGAVAGLCSPDCTNEELFLFKRFMAEAVRSDAVSAESLRKPGYEDELLLKADKHPNSRGVEFQQPWKSLSEILEAIGAGSVKVLVVLRNDFLGLADGGDAIREQLKNLDALVVIDSNASATSDAADVVLPAGTFAEREGTYVNFQGRIQRIFRAYLPRFQAKSESEILRQIADRLGTPLEKASNAVQLWQQLAESVEAFKAIEIKNVGTLGVYANGCEPAPEEAAVSEDA